MAKVYANNRRVLSKYGVRTDINGKQERTADGILFASKRECKRYRELKLLETAGEIAHIVCQPLFSLWVHTGVMKDEPVAIGNYIADFGYTTKDGKDVIEDVKGFKTPLYRWKKKHVEAQYGITIREI